MSTQLPSFRFASASLGAAVAGLVLAAGSAAAAGPQVRTAAVRYGDLNLASDAGVRTLYTRLRAAAGNVCGPRDNRYMPLQLAWEKCRDEALATAIAEFGNTRLAALHRSSSASQS
jgi:UrcA family protein